MLIIKIVLTKRRGKEAIYIYNKLDNVCNFSLSAIITLNKTISDV